MITTNPVSPPDPTAFRTLPYTTVHAQPHSPLTHRIYLRHEDRPTHALTPIVDAIPLHNYDDTTFNMVCEIPRFTSAKMEIDWKTPNQPIKQDRTVDGQLREYKLSPMPFNYGALPQTWEDPAHRCQYTGHCGDDDPLDVIDIGGAVATTGLVYRVKILGVLGMIDQNETDWKVIAINAHDPAARTVNDVSDVQSRTPRLLPSLREWLRVYKTPEGKPPNEFAFQGQYQNASFAKDIVALTHDAWKDRHPL